MFIDLLGSRSIWQRDGRRGALRAFRGFAELVTRGVEAHPSSFVLTGGIESDAAAFACASTEAALSIARTTYQEAFTGASVAVERDRRTWVRGVVVPLDDASRDLRSTTKLDNRDQITVTAYSTGLLDAISMEKSGFRGMRLLVERSLLTPTVRTAVRLTLGDTTFSPLQRLDERNYPGRVGSEFQDFLWMATSDEEEWRQLRGRMSTRLRYATADEGEIQQAAATQVVFDECARLLQDRGFPPSPVLRRVR